MKPTMLVAVLCAALAACGTESAEPSDVMDVDKERIELADARKQGGSGNPGLQDALDRIANSLEGPGAGRLQGALRRLLAADAAARPAALQEALDAVTAMEQAGGDAVGAEMDAIRLTLAVD